jgi:hypothetical protein
MLVSVVIPAYNAARYLRKCLGNLYQSTAPFECIVVDDGSTDDTVKVAEQFGAKVIHTGKRSGPARARNMGAKAATGDILFFIDADVCVYPNTVQRVITNFTNDPALAAVIGSYDEEPESQDFLSQYRNLMHCYVHQNSRQEACTFWSGCGAIRKDLFLSYAGFDESYDRPAIEDIELGYRLAADGHKLALDPGLLVKHLKVWSFLGVVKTDIFDRGVPWTELILRDKRMPNDLNLQLSQRVSVALVFVLVLVAAVAAVYVGQSFLLPLFALLFLALLAYEAEAISMGGSPRAAVGLSVLIVAIGGLAWRSGHFGIFPPLLLAFVLLFLRHRYLYEGERRRRMTGLVCGVYILFVVLFVITYLPYDPLVFAFFLILTVLVLLNNQFYVFLAGKGRLFALAAIPFHLLFHFYNGISFMIGLARHTMRRWFPSAEKKTVQAQR